MAYDPARHHRRSIRLPHHDYAQPGWYFVTICVQDRACLLGEVAADTVRLPEAGRIVARQWQNLPRHFPHVHPDAFVVMPNHVHAIIGIAEHPGAEHPRTAGPNRGGEPDGATEPDGVGAPLVGALPEAEPTRDRAGPRPAPTTGNQTSRRGNQTARHDAPYALGDVVGSFKSLTTNAYIRGVKAQGWPPFDRRLWQRNYWERIVRTDRELANVRRYIADNPLRWHLDRLYENRRTR